MAVRVGGPGGLGCRERRVLRLAGAAVACARGRVGAMASRELERQPKARGVHEVIERRIFVAGRRRVEGKRHTAGLLLPGPDPVDQEHFDATEAELMTIGTSQEAMKRLRKGMASGPAEEHTEGDSGAEQAAVAEVAHAESSTTRGVHTRAASECT